MTADRTKETFDHAASLPLAAWDYAERFEVDVSHLRGICVATPHNFALHIMSNVPEAHGEAVVEAPCEERRRPLRFDKAQQSIAKLRLVRSG
jgi:hypothetical protein